MSFDIYPKKWQIVLQISIKCNQALLGILFTNQITELIKVQYLQNELRDEIDFLYVYISKGAIINMYIGSAQKCPDSSESTHKVLSK